MIINRPGKTTLQTTILRFSQHLWADLLYGVLALLYTYPVVLHPRSTIRAAMK